ncbi:hypothetical protein DPMN_014041 [Dreissena polymorpha]|uniref:Uncharacterized protein n=1 Tax=Dreissena polymorpha TaxID=45954 RepID=A0A9D4NA09_DREPO|nr:hypothetical protein DPMN_014041 [Dreissena polymorpha]
MVKVPRGHPSIHRDKEKLLKERHYPDIIPAKVDAKVKNPTKNALFATKTVGSVMLQWNPENVAKRGTGAKSVRNLCVWYLALKDTILWSTTTYMKMKVIN